MSDKQFPDGLRAYKPNEKAPEFVKAELEIDCEKFASWAKAQGEAKIRLTVKQSQKGSYYAEVNTFKKQEPKEDLPF